MQEEKNATVDAVANITRFTASGNNLLTKQFSLTPDGKLQKKTAARLSDGTFETLTVSGANAFVILLQSLKHTQALSFGVAAKANGRVMSERAWEQHYKPAGVILRKRKFFTWPAGGGIMMLDYDAPASGAMGRDALLAELHDVMPGLQEAAHVWAASASSCIFNEETGEELKGLNGQHVYVFVQDAADIPRAGKVLTERLWLAGHGRFGFNAAGAWQNRTLVDSLVWQPERLDFAAGAKCEAPLAQRRPEPLVLGGAGAFDTRSLVELNKTENGRQERLQRQAKAAVEDERQKTRAAFVEKKSGEMVARGVEEKRAREIVQQAVDGSVLSGDFVLLTEDGDAVTVAEVLDAREVWHGRRFHDPLEPDYRDDDRVAYADLLSGRPPALISHAHGIHVFKLRREAVIVTLRAGSMHEAVSETAAALCRDGDFFVRGNSLVKLGDDGKIKTLDLPGLKQSLGGRVFYQRWHKKEKELCPVDVPDDLAKRLLAISQECGLPVLRGIADHPLMAPDGRLLDRPGFDQATGLLLLANEDWPEILRRPTEEQVMQALGVLWLPYRAFPFVDDTARGVWLAALLTAVVRPLLPIAPAYMVNAPSAGSGKTLLAQCLVELAGGAPATAFPDNETEMEKRLLAALRTAPAAVFFDNVKNSVDSAFLNAVLTSPVTSGRILGRSDMAGDVPTNALFVFTGNNSSPGGDTCRRMLVCRIDAEMERPFTRHFDFNPLAMVRAHRMEMIAAALTILVDAGVDPEWKAPGDALGFDAWEGLVRRAVLYVRDIDRARCKPGEREIGFGDPDGGVEAAYENDNENASLAYVLSAMHAVQDGVGFTSAQLMVFLQQARDGYDNDIGTGLQELVGNVHSLKKLTSSLQYYEKRPAGGFRLETSRNRDKTLTWLVRRM